MSEKRVILGVDPGLATVGYAYLKCIDDKIEIIDFGTINTPAGLDLAERLVMIQSDLDDLNEKYQATESYVEELFFSSNTKTAIDVAQARGVIMSSLASHGLKPRSIKPNQVKLSVTGDGAADKRQIQDMIMMQFSLSSLPQPDDAADAIAIALCGALNSSLS